MKPEPPNSAVKSNVPPEGSLDAAAQDIGLVLLYGDSLAQWARQPPDAALTLLVVPEGIGMRALRNAAEAYFTGGLAGSVVVSMHRRWGSKKRRTSPVTGSETAIEEDKAVRKRHKAESLLTSD